MFDKSNLNSQRLNFSVQDTQIIKGLAVIILVIHHLFARREANWVLFAYNENLMLAGKPLITALVSGGCGKVCVDLFVLMSGYGLAESYRRKFSNSGTIADTYRYILKKLMKFMMGFWFVYILFGGLFALAGKIDPIGVYGTGLKGLLSFFLDFTGLQDLLFEIFHTKTINPTWWYISLLIVSYLLFPVFNKAAESKLRYIPVLLMAAVYLYAPFASYRQMKTGFIYFLPMFYLGILISQCEIFDRMKRISRHLYWLRLICSIALVAFAHKFTSIDRFRGEPILAIALVLMCFTLFIERSAILHWAPIRAILSTLGKNSGNIFLFHTFFLLTMPKFTYCLRYPIPVTVFFLSAMLLCSVLTEFLKKFIRNPKKALRLSE